MRALYKEKGLEYKPEILSCGDTLKQLMVRCSRLLVRKPNDWTESQAERAKVLFCRFLDMKEFIILLKDWVRYIRITTTRTWHDPNSHYGLIRLSNGTVKSLIQSSRRFKTIMTEY